MMMAEECTYYWGIVVIYFCAWCMCIFLVYHLPCPSCNIGRTFSASLLLSFAFSKFFLVVQKCSFHLFFVCIVVGVVPKTWFIHLIICFISFLCLLFAGSLSLRPSVLGAESEICYLSGSQSFCDTHSINLTLSADCSSVI